MVQPAPATGRRGFVFLSAGLVRWAAISAAWTRRCRVYCGARCNRRRLPGRRSRGSNNGASNALTQSYNSGTYAPNTARRRSSWITGTSILPKAGGIESNGGAALGTMSLTLVAGTNQTYRVAADCCAAGPSDYKRLGLAGFAGRYLAARRQQSSHREYRRSAELEPLPRVSSERVHARFGGWAICI